MTTLKEEMAMPTPVMMPAVTAMMLALGEMVIRTTPNA